MALYIKYSTDIYNVYIKYFAPEDIHVYSIDEVFIDATSYLALYKTDARRLEKYFLYTMGDVARLSLKNPKLLYKEFGIDAEILIDHAWGVEPVGMKEIKGYKTQAKSLGSGQVLHEPYDYEKAKIIVREIRALANDSMKNN